MELTQKLLTELQNRLKVGTRRGVHLNAIPARSRYKFDLNRLSYIENNLPTDFIKALLTEQPLRFKISWKDNVPDLNSLFEEDQAQLVKITQSFENLINQTEAIESEKGINTFGFGFPLLIRRDQADNKLTVAPILIWSLRIKRTKEFNTWVIHRNEDDPIYINEILINHLQSDSKIEIGQVSSEMLDDGLIDIEELLDICVSLIESINSTTPDDIRETFSQKLDSIKSIPDKKHYEKLPLTSNNSFIDFVGLFSIFEVQKQNIINDYGDLMELEGISIDLEDLEGHSFQPISSVETDPSQQGILHSLESTRNILIQGPPGTGKSQSLTAVLVNTAENHKKTIVVCEKRAALDVLHKALNERGLSTHCVLIKDIIKDRRTVVNSVRDRIDNSSYRRYRYDYSKDSLDILISRSKSLINSINKKHKKLGEKLLGNNNWTHTVGSLLTELKDNDENYELDFDKTQFKYDSKELNELLQIVKKGQKLFGDYRPYEDQGFLNPLKLVGDNPFIIEQKLEADFKAYRDKLYGENSTIKNILEIHKVNPDLFDLKRTNSISYKISSLFSKTKRQTLNDQKTLFELCSKLNEQIEKDNWIKKSIDNQNSQDIIEGIESLLKTKDDYSNNENDLFTIEFMWFQFYNGLSDTNQALIDKLKLKTDWRKVFLIYYLNSLLVYSATTDLPTSDIEHKELEESLSKIGKEQLKYINEYWYSQQIDATSDFQQHHPNLSVENLYNKRSSPHYKRLALRQIVKFDPDLFSTFFPIILTTPDVCSNLFKGMNKYFDIVLFDEASQLRLEDTLPALLKGKQIIIAGDEHQMPPSNYFSKIFDGTIDDEDEIEEDDEIRLDLDNNLLSCESLLDFATELSFEKRYLDFHYRSRHPFLIDFSNHAFYNKRLKPLPSSFEYNPIKYVQVNGTYSEHSNEREAESVLSILENNIYRLPNGEYPSVGIATFNIAQRNLIIGKILERQKFERFAEFNQKIVELEKYGLFVKNLENIQGDERDVIILSTTYGINKDGKFAQRFGPINHHKGYKLLNVIITRAKYKVYVCTSVPEQVFLNYKEHLTVESSNNRRAVFFAYLAYAKAVSESDIELRHAVLNSLSENSTERTTIDYLNADLESPFEEEVYQELIEHFEEKKIIPQLQFAGFRIDIVYDPEIEGLPKIAIECDGAAYHSSREAYLYDLHRQKILERHGFVFHRIWSTSWWRNQKRESKKLIEFIKSIETKNPKSFEDRITIGLAFTDDIRGINIIPSPQTLTKQKEVEESIATIEKDTPVQTILFKEVVKTNSKVKVRYLNNGNDLNVQLVESKTNEPDKSNGIKKIFVKSPLAVSIIGKSVGDTVKVGNLDNYVEILEIIN